MTRAELWKNFIALLSQYAAVLREPDINSFVSGMLPTPAGQETRDPSFSRTYHRLFPSENVDDDSPAVYRKLAQFIDEELVGWWVIPAAKRIADDLRLASVDPNAAPEPLHTWTQALNRSR